MLKRLAVFTIALLLVCVQGYAQTQKAKQGQNSDQPSPTAPKIAPQQHDSPQHLQGEPTHNVNAEVRVISTPAKDRYDKSAVWINFALGIVGFAGIGTALCTLRKIERQIKVAEADTQAMIRAERAWVIVSVKEITSGEYVFVAKNEGKTPAKIQSVWCTNLWTPREVELSIPPDDQTSESQLQNPPFLLPPGAERSIWRCKRTDVERMSGGGVGEQSRFARGFGAANFYGRIRYRNVLDADATILHETRWFYLLIPQPGTVPIADPFHPEHNSYS